jgi:hypothetical protein
MWSLVMIVLINCVGSPKMFEAIEGAVMLGVSTNGQKNADGRTKERNYYWMSSMRGFKFFLVH